MTEGEKELKALTLKELKAMRLHDRKVVDTIALHLKILRVPSGWIYEDISGTSTFVPEKS